jgi:citrate synthase
VLESGISLIHEGALYYRGRSAVELARRRTVEEVAGLIWLGELDAGPELFAGSEVAPAGWEGLLAGLDALLPLEACQVLLPLAAQADLQALDLRPLAVAQTGARLLRFMTRVVVAVGSGAGEPTSEVSWPGVAAQLQAGWIPSQPEGRSLINAALILCADHELNVSAFTARCVASAGAGPYSAVVAGICALQGYKHGGETPRAEALLDEAARVGARAAVLGRLRRGEALPGFDHPLYPQGDPRARLLLDMLKEAFPQSTTLQQGLALVESMEGLTGRRPTVDLGLALVGRTLELPPGAALALFALGRTIGWIGHSMETYAVDRLIRPRARYTGPLPAGLDAQE